MAAPCQVKNMTGSYRIQLAIRDLSRLVQQPDKNLSLFPRLRLAKTSPCATASRCGQLELSKWINSFISIIQAYKHEVNFFPPCQACQIYLFLLPSASTPSFSMPLQRWCWHCWDLRCLGWIGNISEDMFPNGRGIRLMSKINRSWRAVLLDQFRQPKFYWVRVVENNYIGGNYF